MLLSNDNLVMINMDDVKVKVGSVYLRKDSKKLFFESPIELRGKNTVLGVEKIGAYTYVGSDSVIVNVSSIGRYCSIAPDVRIGLYEHDTSIISTSPVFWGGQKTVFNTYEYKSFLKKNAGIIKKSDGIIQEKNIKKVTIGNDVWIGEHAFVRIGVNVGDGAVIAARAVVTKDVPPYSIVAGVPGRIIGKRFSDEIIEALINIKWWNYDLSIFNDFDFSNITVESVRELKKRVDRCSQAQRSVNVLEQKSGDFFINGNLIS